MAETTDTKSKFRFRVANPICQGRYLVVARVELRTGAEDGLAKQKHQYAILDADMTPVFTCGKKQELNAEVSRIEHDFQIEMLEEVRRERAAQEASVADDAADEE